MWVARDENGIVYLYDNKPVKGDTKWVLPNTTSECCIIDNDLDGFEDVKWEDEEPRELILK